MSDDLYHGTVAIGGKLTREQFDHCQKLIEDVSEFEEGIGLDGRAYFCECTADDFFDLRAYCIASNIALFLQWHSDGNSYQEYFTNGEERSYGTNRDGDVVVPIFDLQRYPNMTIGKYIEALDIPTFPALEIITNHAAA